MYSLLISFAVLIIGYMVFSRITDNVFMPDSRKTPAIAINDGVDCVPMSKPKLFLVQLLNIAGTGPIFGPIMGAVFGPVVFLWIIFGTILGGAVHDFMVGMISSRNKGASIAELSGIYIGKVLKWIMRGFSVLLLILCGTVFLVTPASILADLTPDQFGKWFFVILIIAYYFLATILPIDKIIGKLYPIFGLLLLIMAFSVLGAIFVQGKAMNIPEWWNYSVAENPNGLPTWPFMFVTVACGAISGFHATQSPMVAKCIQNEKQGRQVFYGAMVGEAIIALIWAAVGVAFYGSTQLLQQAIISHNSDIGPVIHEISEGLLGPVGGVLAIIGVVVCPITSGDTAFRGARLIVAEATHLDQKKIFNRLILTVPIVGAGVGLAFLDFTVLWRYFAAANQTLAMVALWIASFYLLRKNQYKHADLITAVPASFMVAVSITYIIVAKECINAPIYIGYPLGASIAGASFIAYMIYRAIYLRAHAYQHRPLMFSYLHKEKKEAKIMVKEFKEELTKKGYKVINKNDVDMMLLKVLANYKTYYEFLEKLRIASRVEEILNLQEALKRAKYKNKSKRVTFFNFFRRIDFRLKIKYKRFTAKFMKRHPMDIGVYYRVFKYSFDYALRYGVMYMDKNDEDALIVVYPNNFQRINYTTIQAISLKIYALFSGKAFEVNRAAVFDDACRLHIVEKVNDRYWYIYDMQYSKKEEVNERLLKVLVDFMDKKKLKLYIDTLYHTQEELYKHANFKPVVNETIDYAQVPYTLLLRKPR